MSIVKGLGMPQETPSMFKEIWGMGEGPGGGKTEREKFTHSMGFIGLGNVASVDVSAMVEGLLPASFCLEKSSLNWGGLECWKWAVLTECGRARCNPIS